MKMRVAKMGRLVAVLSSVVVALFLGAFVAGFFLKPIFALAGLLCAICLWVYLCWTPVAYEYENNRLTIFYRIGVKTFENAVRTSVPARFPKYFVKIWANGGLFALAGQFWSMGTGLFYAYTSTTVPDKIISFESEGKLVFISPECPDSFAEKSN